MALWIMLLVVWAVVETIQLFRKKPLRARMKAGAIWGTVLASLALYGQASSTANFNTFLLGMAMFATAALVIYWVRVGIAGMLAK